MAINIPGSAFHGISNLGSSAPEAGFYAVDIVTIETSPTDKPGTRRFHAQFETGFKMFEFVSLAYDENGHPIQGLDEQQVRGRMAALQTILASLGYNKSDIDQADSINESWFLSSMNNGRKAHVEFVPGQKGVQKSYHKIKSWVTKTQYDAMKAVTANTQTVEATPSVATAPIPAVTANGAPVPSSGVALPPPASAAQNIVS